MKKSLIALLLVVALVVTVSVFAASAESTNPFEGKTDEIVQYYCPSCKVTADWYPVDLEECETKAKEYYNWVNYKENGATHFYFPCDMVDGSSDELKDGVKLCYNLNGMTITRNTNTTFKLSGTTEEEAPVLTIIDTSADGSGTYTAGAASGQNFFYANGTGTVNVYGGNIHGGGVDIAAGSGSNPTLIGGTDANSVTFNLYGGILKGYSLWSNGMIKMQGSMTINVEGATLEGKGGNGVIGITSAKSKLYLKSGSITGTPMNSTKQGSAIVISAGLFEMTGGTLTGAATAATDGGGAIRQSGGTTNLKGGTIKDSSAAKAGGAIYMSGASAVMNLSGTTIENCTTPGTGGAIYIQWKAQGYMTGGTIKNCSAKSGGAVGLVGTNPSFTMSGGTIENCYASFSGGGVNAAGSADGYATFNMSGGTIKGCDAKTWGAGVCLSDLKGVFNMSDSAVLDGAGSVITDSGNKGVWLGFYGAGTANLNGGTCKNAGGGAICLNNVANAILNLNGTTFETTATSPDSWARIFMLGLPSTAQSTVNMGPFSGKFTIDYWASSGDSDAIYEAGTVLTNCNVADSVGQFQAFVYNTSMNRMPLLADNGKLKVVGFAGVTTDSEKFPLTAIEGDYLYYELYSDNDITLTKDTMLNMMNRNVLVNNDNYKLSVVGNSAGDASFMVSNPANLNRLAVNTNNGYQFVTIQDGATETGAPKFTTHRIQVDIDSVSIKPATADLYYNVNIVTNAKLAKYLDKYGVALDLTAMPDAGFGSCDTTMYTEEKFSFTEGEGAKLEGVRSCLLTGILPTQVVNGEKSGEMPIFANAYVTLSGLAADGGVLTVMADNPVNYSLWDIMLMVNANEELATNAAVVEMYKKFIDDMGGWKLDKIAAAAAA